MSTNPFNIFNEEDDFKVVVSKKDKKKKQRKNEKKKSVMKETEKKKTVMEETVFKEKQKKCVEQMFTKGFVLNLLKEAKTHWENNVDFDIEYHLSSMTEENKSAEPIYPLVTKLCNFFKRDKCDYGEDCYFLHYTFYDGNTQHQCTLACIENQGLFRQRQNDLDKYNLRPDVNTIENSPAYTCVECKLAMIPCDYFRCDPCHENVVKEAEKLKDM